MNASPAGRLFAISTVAFLGALAGVLVLLVGFLGFVYGGNDERFAARVADMAEYTAQADPHIAKHIGRVYSVQIIEQTAEHDGQISHDYDYRARIIGSHATAEATIHYHWDAKVTKDGEVTVKSLVLPDGRTVDLS